MPLDLGENGIPLNVDLGDGTPLHDVGLDLGGGDADAIQPIADDGIPIDLGEDIPLHDVGLDLPGGGGANAFQPLGDDGFNYLEEEEVLDDDMPSVGLDNNSDVLFASNNDGGPSEDGNVEDGNVILYLIQLYIEVENP